MQRVIQKRGDKSAWGRAGKVRKATSPVQRAALGNVPVQRAYKAK